MFVWAMRDKGSEWRAMRRFLEAGRLPFSPLVEAVCEPYLTRSGESAKSPVEVVDALGGKVAPLTDSGRAWVDLGHLTRLFSASDVSKLHRVVRQASGLSIHLVTPVVHTSSPGEVVEAVLAWAREERSGICIRVDGGTHLSQKAVEVRTIVTESGLGGADIDLILDAQDLPRAISYETLRDAFPISQGARTWAVVAGTFPPSITDMSPEIYQHTRDRDEWLAWREEITQSGHGRLPIYGDYATQPALYTPSPPFPGSPSVRYTTGEHYVVLRGRGSSGSIGPDYTQYVGHARYLSQQPYFCDVVTTGGDAYARRIASGAHGTGNLTTWRVASLERHLSVVAAQVAQFVPALSQGR